MAVNGVAHPPEKGHEGHAFVSDTNRRCLVIVQQILDNVATDKSHSPTNQPSGCFGGHDDDGHREGVGLGE